jgi:hypothetical protein
MNSKPNHITELFKQYADLRQNSLRRTDTTQKSSENRVLKYLLDRFHLDADVSVLSRALSDPYFPIGMLEQTIFADVVGMRFFINKKRWDIEPVLARELVEFASVFLKIRHDIQILFDPVTITCIPLDGTRHHLPSASGAIFAAYAVRSAAYPLTRRQKLFIRITGSAFFPAKH